MNKHVLTVTAVMGVVLSVAAMVQGCGPAPSVNSGAQASNLSPQAVNRQQEGDAVLLARIQKLEKQLQEQADTLTNVRADLTALISDLSDTKTRQGERIEAVKKYCAALRDEIANGVVTKSVSVVNEKGEVGTHINWGALRSGGLRLDAYSEQYEVEPLTNYVVGRTWCRFGGEVAEFLLPDGTVGARIKKSADERRYDLLSPDVRGNMARVGDIRVKVFTTQWCNGSSVTVEQNPTKIPIEFEEPVHFAFVQSFINDMHDTYKLILEPNGDLAKGPVKKWTVTWQNWGRKIGDPVVPIFKFAGLRFEHN